MKAFYVPELTSNALRVSEPDGDPSAVVSQLIKAAAAAQVVCRTGTTGRADSYMFSPPVFPISLGVVSGAATNEVNHQLLSCLLRRG